MVFDGNTDYTFLVFVAVVCRKSIKLPVADAQILAVQNLLVQYTFAALIVQIFQDNQVADHESLGNGSL